MTVAATLAGALLSVVAFFQFALALGAPLGQAAWGGRYHGVLPTAWRFASAVSALSIYPLIILFVLASADLTEVAWLPGTGQTAMWILTGFFALGTVANFASRSKIERIWGPVSMVIAICCGIIAAGIEIPRASVFCRRVPISSNTCSIPSTFGTRSTVGKDTWLRRRL